MLLELVPSADEDASDNYKFVAGLNDVRRIVEL